MTAASFRRRSLARAVRALLARSVPAQNALIRLIRWCYRWFASELYAEAFRRYRPNLVVGTRALTMSGPRSGSADRYLDRHLLLSAARRRIPTMVLVASWDNLTTSGFFPTDPDCITVWNEVMKEQAQRIHGIDPLRIVVTSAPAARCVRPRAVSRPEDVPARAGPGSLPPRGGLRDRDRGHRSRRAGPGRPDRRPIGGGGAGRAAARAPASARSAGAIRGSVRTNCGGHRPGRLACVGGVSRPRV